MSKLKLPSLTRAIYALMSRLAIRQARLKRKALFATVAKCEAEIAELERSARQHRMLAHCRFRTRQPEPARIVALPTPRRKFTDFTLCRKSA